MNTSGKFQRKFLLRREIPIQKGASPSPLQLGCLSAGGHREIFVCKVGRERFLLTREGRGRFLRETKQKLGPRAFDDFWKSTEGFRIFKKFLSTSQEGLDFLVESIDCAGTIIHVAVFEFPTRAAATSFVPPAFVGTETTFLEEFSDTHLAMYGVPPVRNGRSQSGALPFLFRNGILHVVLVTSSSGTRWIVPKGGLEKGMSRCEVALMEAAEEAGAIGMLEPGIKAHCRMNDGRILHLFPLRVAALLPSWPERTVRRRVVLPIYRALLRVCDPGLAEAMRKLSRQLER